MSEPAMLVASSLTGFVLGLFFYGGLWWTVQKTLTAPSPAPWILGSALVRMSTVLGGFYLVAGSHGMRWLLCMLGLTLARPVVAWVTRRSAVELVAPRRVRDAPQS